MLNRFLILILAILVSFGASTGEKKKLYKWVDENGNVHFSDEPHKGAEELELKEVPTIKMDTPKYNSGNLSGSISAYDESTADDDNYQVAKLVEPLDNGVVRNNASLITLTAQVSPALDENHSIRFFLNGKPVSTDPKALTVTVEKAAYGEHTAYFVILNSKGKQIQTSDKSTFQLLHMINPNIRQQRKKG